MWRTFASEVFEIRVVDDEVVEASAKIVLLKPEEEGVTLNRYLKNNNAAPIYLLILN